MSLFVLFNSFALVQYLQYKPVGKWSDYLRGERAYIILSLVGEIALRMADLRQHADPAVAGAAGQI